MVAAAILVAAGAGARLGASRPKAFVELRDEPLYAHAGRALAESGALASLVVVVPDGLADEAAAVLRQASVAGAFPMTVVVGGPSRQASVALGLARLGADVDIVLVHDAARALVPPGLIRAVVAAVEGGHGAVVPGLPVADTLKRVGAADAAGARPVQATLEREPLRAIQTPQGFRRDLLDRAHLAGSGRAGSEATAAGDDAGLVEAMGEAVHVVPGDPLAFKITAPFDLLVAGALLERR